MRSAYCYRPSSVVCQSVCHLVSHTKTAKAIEMPFASRTLVGPGKHLLHIADRFGRILYRVHSTQYSLLVVIIAINYIADVNQLRIQKKKNRRCEDPPPKATILDPVHRYHTRIIPDPFGILGIEKPSINTTVCPVYLFGFLKMDLSPSLSDWNQAWR